MAVASPRVIFWDVDTQYDFMKADGKLYVPDAEQLIPNLKKLTDYAHGHGICIVASADDHVPEHAEISANPDWKTTFPPHCLHGTPGQRKIPETTLRDPLVIEPAPQDSAALVTKVRSHRGDILFHKHRFDVFSNPNVLSVLDVAEHLLKEWGEEGVRLVKTSEVVVGGLVEELERASA